MRPTKNVNVTATEVADKPEWKTVSNWLHLDANLHGCLYNEEPNACYGHGYASIGSFKKKNDSINFRQTMIPQSLLALTDQKACDGGFHCIPGSHRFSMEWTANNRKSQVGRANVQISKENFPELHTRIR